MQSLIIERYESNAASKFLHLRQTSPIPYYYGPPLQLASALSPNATFGSSRRFRCCPELRSPSNGIRVEKGAELFRGGRHFRRSQKDWKSPRPAIQKPSRAISAIAPILGVSINPQCKSAAPSGNTDASTHPRGSLDHNLLPSVTHSRLGQRFTPARATRSQPFS